MKTYYYFNANCELIAEAQFLTDAEAFDFCFSDARICAWNDKPYLEI
jgi:hypothetical protein